MQKNKWTPATLIKRPDNIISSKARESGNVGFKPSYLAEPKEDMRFIMSNEYMRIWFKERGKHEKNTYSKDEIIKEESKIKRRFVQRMMTYKKPDKNEFIEDKLQKSNKKGGEAKEHPADYSKFKYKPVCLKQKHKEMLHVLVRGDPNGSTNANGSLQKPTVSQTEKDKTDEEEPPIILCPQIQTCLPLCPQ